MNKRVSIIFLLIFINISVFAEVGAGYYFRFNNFKLSIDFNEYALDRYLQEDEKYIDASKCFYSILQTLYFYINELEKENITISLHQFEMIPIEDDEITVVIEKDNVFSTFVYYLNDDISYEENIYLILNSFLPFSLKKHSVKTIKLYRISADLKDYDNLDWIYKWNEGNIFFGTFLSYFFDYSKNEYVSYFFSKKDALKFIKKYNLTKEYLSEIEITTGNAYTTFGSLVN